jgi:hypothetical protein
MKFVAAALAVAAPLASAQTYSDCNPMEISELGTIGASGDFAAADLPLVEATGLGEVKVNVGLS